MSAAPDKTDLKSASLDQHGNTLIVAPIIDRLRVAFRTTAHRPNRKRGLAIERSLSPLLHVDRSRNTLFCHAGLKPLVIEALHEQGYSIQDHGRDIDSRLKKLPDPVLPSGEKVPEIIANVLRSEGALIYFNPAEPLLPARVIAIAAMAWPNRRIVCAVTRESDAYELTRQLGRWVSKERLYCVNASPGLVHRAQVVIGTYAHVGGCEGDLHNTDFLFSLHPAEMLTNYYGKRCCRDVDQARVFAFLPIGQKLPSHQRDRI